MEPRTLLIGKSKRLLSRLAGALRDEGCPAAWSSRVDALIDGGYPAAYDLVVTGRGIQIFDKKVLKAHFTHSNPNVRFVDGLAPILPLLVDQVKLAWASFAGKKPVLSSLQFEKTPGGTRMQFRLEEPATLTLELYRLTFLYRMQLQAITLDRITKGVHELLLPASVFGKASPQFAVVKNSGDVVAAEAIRANLVQVIA